MANTGLLVQGIGDVTVVGFTNPSLLDSAAIQRVGEELYDLVDNRDKRKIILNFASVQFLSSTALGVLINLKRKADAIKGQVVLCGLRPELQRVFKITNLHKMFRFFPDEVKAMSGFDA
jgi:anti-anti-sigma factor